jgi:hypothetical protein
VNKPKRYRTIKQPEGSFVCGSACAAMIVGKTLAEVLIEADWKRLSFVTGIAEYVARHDIILGLGLAASPRNLETAFDIEISLKDRPALIAVPGEGNWGHWIFWDGKKLRDPAPNPKGNYIIEEIWPITYFELEDGPGD